MIKSYKHEFENCKVSYYYETQDGVKLGVIVSHIRHGVRKITPSQKAKLDELGFVWNLKKT